jgi:hypothetical protein
MHETNVMEFHMSTCEIRRPSAYYTYPIRIFARVMTVFTEVFYLLLNLVNLPKIEETNY